MNEFCISPDVTFLNHGSFGATPRSLLNKQRKLQELLEQQPVHFMERLLPGMLEESKSIVANFLGAPSEDLVFIPNATTAMNMILGNIDFRPGDEILATNHQYDAVRNTIHRIASQTGAAVRIIDLTFPSPSSEAILDLVVSAATQRTKAILLDHITSPTAVRLPVEEVAAHFRDSDIRVVVDGAHAPGQIDINLDAHHFDYWTGNLHKWCCAPKGCALMYVAPKHQRSFHSQITSHGYQNGMQAEFSWLGTDDFSPYLLAGEAIQLHQAWGGAQFRRQNFELMQAASDLLLNNHPSFIANQPQPTLAMRSFDVGKASPSDLYHKCLHEKNIEVVFQEWNRRCFMRISCFSRYNDLDQYKYLSGALKEYL